MSAISKVLVILMIAFVLGGGGWMYTQTHAKNAGSVKAAAPKQPVIHHVALTDKGADPADLLITVGEYVEFDSKDGKVHDIAIGAGDGDGEHHDHTATGLESGDFKADEGYRVQFNKIGSYYFHDHRRPSLTISVAVYQPSASSSILK